MSKKPTIKYTNKSFSSIKDALVEHAQRFYPDRYTDFNESSFGSMMMDSVAYVGDMLSFYIDYQANENFLETAERRNSILRLARLISYNAKRNKPATGLLKIDSLTTTEDVFDSTGTNLSNEVIIWNDSANNNYREQFTAILNAANQTGQLIGKPRESGSIGGISTEVYTLSSSQTDLPIFNFSANIGGTARNFEIVS